VKPEVGKAVLFYNQLPDGNYDERSQHAALPVIIGTKWLTNLWVWVRTENVNFYQCRRAVIPFVRELIATVIFCDMPFTRTHSCIERESVRCLSNAGLHEASNPNLKAVNLSVYSWHKRQKPLLILLKLKNTTTKCSGKRPLSWSHPSDGLPPVL
jgi:hypothetical protein